MIFEQPLSDYYVAKMLDYSPKVEFFMQFIIDLKIFVDNSIKAKWARQVKSNCNRYNFVTIRNKCQSLGDA